MNRGDYKTQTISSSDFSNFPTLIMRVVWFDNLETILTNKDPVLVFLDTYSNIECLVGGNIDDMTSLLKLKSEFCI